MGSKCCKCTSDKTTSPQRSSSTYSYPRSRTRKRMIGDDWQVEEHIEDERFSHHKSGGTTVSSGRPILSRSLTDITVKVGTRTRFLIEVSSPTPVTVRWEKNGKTVEDTDRLKLATEGQFYCLDISPVVLEDSGSWTVWVKNSIGVTRSNAELSLIVPKAYKKPEFVEPLRAVLTAQGTVSLECKVVGVPTPTLRWLKGNSEIKAGDILALTADASDPTSLGTYSCLASNCMGKAESTSIVHLNGSSSTVGFLPSGPKPKFLKELRNEKVKLGEHVTLECKISVPPWPEEIHWYGPSGEVVEGERAHLIEDGAGMYSITLHTVTSEDNGTWKCVATNKLGAKSVSTANLTVNYPKNYRKPKFLESLKAILTEEGLVSFECKVVGYPTPNLSWLKDGKELKPGDVYQLTGTNSLGSYCCIAKNCMGQAESSAELTLEDIKSQLSEEERLQLSSEKLPPRFIQGLKSSEAKINESFKFTVQVSIFPESTVLWFKDDEIVEKSEKYKLDKDRIGTFHLEINKLEFSDQAEWKCVATNDFGQSVTSCFLKLNIPRHYKKPKFLEDLKAVMSDEGAVNLECKVIGVPQPKLKWFKDGRELKAGDIHKIISGQDGTCCLGTYTCLAQNCMGTVSSSASLLGFEEKGVKSAGIPESIKGHALSRDRSLSTIHEERTSQLHDTEKSTTIDDRAEEVSFSFDGKEVSVSLYETPDLTEEEALQIVEMYADQISEHVSEHNLVELPPMRFTKESSTSGKLMMEALVIDVNPEYFTTAPTSPKVVEDDLRTDADVDEFSLVEEITIANLTPDEVKTTENIALEFEARAPLKPPRSKNKSHYKEDEKDISEGNVKANVPEAKPKKKKKSTDSEKEDDSLQEFERRKILEKQVISKPEKKRTDSELEDDSLYEFENRKTKEDDIKAFQRDNRQSIQEIVVGRTDDNETSLTNVNRTSIEPFVSKRSITEDEATFNTAEESAFERSEVSVLESLAHSLTEIQKGLVAVEAHVASESSAEMHSAYGLFESLVQPITDVQKSLHKVEAHLSDTQAGQSSTEMLETLIEPIEQFKKNLALMQELNLPVLQSVTCQLDNLDKEIAQIRQTTRSHQQYKKSVTEVQEALSKIIDRQSCVSSDKNIPNTLTAELLQLEENANDELEKYYDRLLNVSTEIRTRANHEEDQEIADILRSVGDLIKPLKKLSAITSRCIAVIVKDNEMGIPPTAKVVEALVKPLEVTNASLRLVENISTLKSHKAIRGTGIPVLYKVSVPMDELDTTINLVENLSAHTAVEFLIPPLENLEKVVKDIDISHGGSGFLENLQVEGVPLVKNLEHSLDVMLDCIDSIQKGVPVDESKRDIAGKLPAIMKPMEELHKSLKSVENGIKSSELSYGEVFSIAQELSKPLQAIRSEFSILQHEIEADHYSTEQPTCQNALINLVEPLEGVQNCITSFHETVMCKSGDDPMHVRFILYALKEMAEPLDILCSKMITAEETLLGKGDPFQGLKAVTRSVSELRESSAAAVSSESNAMEKISIMLSEPLSRVQSGLENILDLVDNKENVNVDVMKDMTEPFKELESALLEIDEQINEEVTEGATPELKIAIQDLLKSITVMPNRSELARTDESIAMDSNLVSLQSLTQPLQTLKAQFAEIQKSSNRTLIKADIALSSLGDSARRVSATLTELKTNVSPQPVAEVLYSLGIVIEDFEATLEDLATNLETTKKLDEVARNLSDSLKIIAEKLSKMCCKMETHAVSVDQGKPKPMVLVKDVMYNLQRAIEQSCIVLSNGKGNAANRNNDTLNTIDQVANAFTTFHYQLISTNEVAAYIKGEPRGVNSLKEHVDELESLLKGALSYEIQDKNDKMVLESISNDIKSVQRVVDNLVLEGNADTARVRFVLAKVESVHEDLKHLSKNHDNQNNFKLACQTSLSILNVGEDLLVPKPKKALEIVPNISGEETSVIGNLLEGIEELESSFEKMKQKANGISDKAIAEMSLELSILQSTVQDLATEASGDLLDKAQELCIPIKAIQEHFLQVPHIKQIDIEDSSESLHNINRVLTAAIKKKEVEKLAQPLTSVIGDLLETVDELEVSFDKQKHKAEWKMVEEESVSKMASEIFILQGIVQDLATEATGDLLDKASKACLPVKMLEETLVSSTRNSRDLEELCEALHNINVELLSAIKQSELEKASKEKEFEKLFSFEALSADLDHPIIKSIVSTVRSMQFELQTASSNPEKNHLREFLQNFGQNLIAYGDAIENRRNGQELLSSLNKMESTLSKFDVNCLESEHLSHAIVDLKNALDDDSMRNVLPGLQTILTQLKALHEELKRTISPVQEKKREAKCLEWFSKASADLERGLLKLEKAILMNKNREIDCMLSPMENMVSYISTITDKTNIGELLEEGVLPSLESLSKPIGDIQVALSQIQDAIENNDDAKAMELLAEIANPVRELRENIALIQDKPLVEISLSHLSELKEAVSVMANQAAEEAEPLKKPLLQLQARLQELNPESELEEVVIELTEPVDSLKQAVENLESCGKSSTLLELCHQVVDIISMADETLSEISTLGQFTQGFPHVERTDCVKIATECQEIYEDNTLSEISISDRPTQALEGHTPALVMGSIKKENIQQDKGEFQRERFDKGIEALKNKIEDLKYENQSSHPTEEKEMKAKESTDVEKKKKEKDENMANELPKQEMKKKEVDKKEAKHLAELVKEKKAKDLADQENKEKEEKRAIELAKLGKEKKEVDEKKAKELADQENKEKEKKKAIELAEPEEKQKEEEDKTKDLAETENKTKEEEEKKPKQSVEQEKKKNEVDEEKNAKELTEMKKKKKKEEEKMGKDLTGLEEMKKKEDKQIKAEQGKEEEENKVKELTQMEKKKKEVDEKEKGKESAENENKKEETKKAKELTERQNKMKEEQEEKAEILTVQMQKNKEEEKKAKELADQEKNIREEKNNNGIADQKKEKAEEEGKKAKESGKLKRKTNEEVENNPEELAEIEKEKEGMKAKVLAEKYKKQKEEEEKESREIENLEKKNNQELTEGEYKKKVEEEEQKMKDLGKMEKEVKEEPKAIELAEQEKKKKKEELKKAQELAEDQRKKKEEEEKKAKEIAQLEEKKKEEDLKKAQQLAEQQREKKEEEEKRAKELAEKEEKKKEEELKKAQELSEQQRKKKEEEKKKAKDLAEKEEKKKEEELKKAQELTEQQRKKKEEEEKKAKELAEKEEKKKEEELKKAQELAEQQRKKKEEEEKKAKQLKEKEEKKKEEELKKAQELAEQQRKKKEEEEKKAKELAEKEEKKKEEERKKAQELAEQQRKKKEEEEKKAKELAEKEEKKKEDELKKAQELAEQQRKKKEEEEKKANEVAQLAKIKKKEKDEEENNLKALAKQEKKRKEEEENKAQDSAKIEKKKKEEREKQTKEIEKNKNKMKEDEVKKAKEIPENGSDEIEENKMNVFIVKKKENKEEGMNVNRLLEQDIEIDVKPLPAKGKNEGQEEDKSSETVEQINAKRKEMSVKDITDQEKKKYLNNQMNVEKLYEPENKIKSQFGSTDQATVDMTTIEDDTTRKRCTYDNLIQYAASGKSGQSLRETNYYNNRGIEVVELPDYEPPVRPERGRRTYGSMRDTARMQDVQENKISSYSLKKSQERSWTHLACSTSDLQRPAPFHCSRRTLSPRKDFSSMQLDSIRYQPTPHYQRSRLSVSPLEERVSSSAYGSTISLTTRRHIDELTAARLRPPILSRSLTSLRSRSITRLEQVGKRAYICNGLLDKTVIHGGKIRLTCNIGGDSNPTIEWHKDGRPISLHTDSTRYKTDWDYGVASLEIPNALTSDSGQYTCIVKNTNGQQATTSTVRVISKKDGEDSEWNPIEPEYEVDVPREVCLLVKGADIGMPRVTNLLADPVVPSGSTIALHVQVAGCSRPDITWLRGGAPLPKYSPRVHYFEDGGLFTLLLEGATPSESGVYTCRISSGILGAVDSTAMVQVVERRPHEKPARFTVKPESRMTLTNGEDMTLTCYVSGEPKPQVTFMKGIKDISKSCRTLKESFGDYVRLTLKRINLDDRGTYFIVAKNIYGTDRAFVTLQIRDRARSHTPTSWSEAKDSFSMLFSETRYDTTHRSTTALTQHEPLQM